MNEVHKVIPKLLYNKTIHKLYIIKPADKGSVVVVLSKDIKPANKGSAVIVLSKDNYIRKADRQLNNPTQSINHGPNTSILDGAKSFHGLYNPQRDD